MNERTMIESDPEKSSLLDSSNSLHSYILRMLEPLSERQRTVIRLRMEPSLEKPERTRTMASIGEELGVTREAIRLAEGEAIRHLSMETESWKILAGKLEELICQYGPFVDVSRLPELVPDLFPVVPSVPFLDYVFSKLMPPFLSLHILYLDGPKLSRISDTRWKAVIQEGKELLHKDFKTKSWTELKKEVLRLLSETKHPVIRDTFLFHVMQGIVFCVRDILENAPHPLHFRKIGQLLSKRGYSVKLRSVHNALVHEDVFLSFGEGLFGLAKHVSASGHHMDKIIRGSVEIIRTRVPEKQIHSDEILSILVREDCGLLSGESLNFARKMSGSDLDALLRSRDIPGIVSLGRRMWRSEGKTGVLQKRITIFEETVRILAEAGKPLSILEIRQRMEQKRGLGKYFQVHPKFPIVRMEKGLYKLAD